jgi:hypothetical protein
MTWFDPFCECTACDRAKAESVKEMLKAAAKHRQRVVTSVYKPQDNNAQVLMERLNAGFRAAYLLARHNREWGS